MKNPTLFEVPRNAPTAHVSMAEFKKKNNILTHRSACMSREDHPWIAIKVLDEDKGKDIGTIMAESCRLYDESGRLATSTGELTAIRKLCEKQNIPCYI